MMMTLLDRCVLCCMSSYHPARKHTVFAEYALQPARGDCKDKIAAIIICICRHTHALHDTATHLHDTATHLHDTATHPPSVRVVDEDAPQRPATAFLTM